jgi:hypothetical protein
MALYVKITIFWDMVPCMSSLIETFGGICCLCLHVEQQEEYHESGGGMFLFSAHKHPPVDTVIFAWRLS